VRCGVVVASLRAEPRDDAEQVSQALLHEPLRVADRLGDWAHVITAYDYPAWIRSEALEHGNGRLPPRVAAEPVELAPGFLGAPYEWGGLTRAGIDCSGLVHMAYRLTGRLVPRDSWQQEATGAPVAPGHELPGDLVSYGSGERADHVAFWLEGGRILHATAREDLGVVEELEPPELIACRRAVIRLPERGIAPKAAPWQRRYRLRGRSSA
jgi:cell wall-associated NlpC family hydrolase